MPRFSRSNNRNGFKSDESLHVAELQDNRIEAFADRNRTTTPSKKEERPSNMEAQRRMNQQRAQEEHRRQEMMNQQRMNEEKTRQQLTEQQRMFEEKMRQQMKEQQGLCEDELRKERMNQERMNEDRLREERIRQENAHMEMQKQEGMCEERLQQELMRQQKMYEMKMREEMMKQKELYEEKLRKERMELNETCEDRMRKEMMNQKMLWEEKIQNHKASCDERVQNEMMNQRMMHDERMQKEMMNQKMMHDERMQKEMMNQRMMHEERMKKEMMNQRMMHDERMRQEMMNQKSMCDNRLEAEMNRNKFQQEVIIEDKMERKESCEDIIKRGMRNRVELDNKAECIMDVRDVDTSHSCHHMPQQSPVINHVRVRILHAAVGFEPIFVVIGNRQFADSLSFGKISSYDRVMDGFGTVMVYNQSSKERPICTAVIPFMAGSKVTLAVVNSVRGIQVIQIQDDVCRGRSKDRGTFRVANLTYDDGPFDVTLNDGTLVFSDVNVKEVTVLKQALAGDYDFYVSGTPLNLRNTSDAYLQDMQQGQEDGIQHFNFYQRIQPDKMYTACIIGGYNTSTPLQVLVIEN